MKKNTTQKIMLQLGVLLLLFPALMFLSWTSLAKTIRAKEYDSRVVNLSGRQRMLSQKMTKETLIFQADFSNTGRRNEALAKQVEITKGIFETTLFALTDSGKAPFSLNPASTNTVHCPVAEEPAHSQLKLVSNHWKIFSSQIDDILRSPSAENEVSAEFLANSLLVLKEMNTAVGMLQVQSEARLKALQRSSLVMLISTAGLTFILLLYIYIRVAKPMDRSSQEIHQLVERQDGMLSTAATSIFCVDSQQRITRVNQEFCRLTGFTEEDVLGKHCRVLQGTPCTTGCGLFSPDRTEPIFRKECTVKTKEGKTLTILKNAICLRNESGEIQGGIESFVDVTELSEACAAANMAAQAKSEFLANMSHEIRTPMNAVIGMCDLLMDTEMSSEQRDFASTIRLSGNALLMLINDILDFSKIEAGELLLEQSEFDLTRCLEETASLVASRAAEKGLELLLELDGNVPAVVCGDEARLRQIILNLLGNAIKFTQEGEICLSVKNDSAAVGQKLTFAIRDTGIGIAPENLEKIFGQFSQADESTTREFGGTGLGLTISRRLCELMDGTMWVESTPGKGTTFYFTVQAGCAQRSRIVMASQKPFAPQNKKVLVVDDNETNVRILNAQLTRWGLEPVSFMKPEEALASIQKGDIYCLMVTDMQMPKMDGSMLVHEIRKVRPSHELPVIMLTSIGQGKPKVSLDIAAVLSKPTKPTQLHQHIENVLHGLPATGVPQVSIAAKPIKKTETKILLVEDNPVNQKVATLMLKKLGYTADVASDGLEALEKVETTAYDLVLMDIQMPNMDGLTATTEIKKRLAGKPCPRIVGMSAHAADEERDRGLAAGMDDYLTKPIQLIKLKEMLSANRAL